MENLMAVLLNGIAQLEYNRDRALSDVQRASLDNMDSKMAAGVDIGGEQPDADQRARFVAASLYHAIKDQNEAMCSALASYLADRLPALKQVRYDEADGNVAIELVFDQAYGKQVPVSFVTH